MQGRQLQTYSKPKTGTGGECSIDEMQATLLALGQVVEQRDGHTGSHCKRLSFLGVAMGVSMGLDRESLVALYRGGYLHDIGKVGIPDAILLKPGKLTGEEWITMRTHTTRGEEICSHVKSLHSVLPIIRHHHERWDGSGYPDGLSGNRIPLLARVLQIADIYDALTNPRAYRQACSPAKAIEILREEDARGWRDPEAVRVFLALYHEVLSRSGDYTGAEGMQASLSHLDRALRDAFVRGNEPILPISLQ